MMENKFTPRAEEALRLAQEASAELVYRCRRHRRNRQKPKAIKREP